MKVTAVYPCPKCKDKIQFMTKKPSYFSPSINSVTCTVCETVYNLKVEKIRGHKDRVNITPI